MRSEGVAGDVAVALGVEQQPGYVRYLAIEDKDVVQLWATDQAGLIALAVAVRPAYVDEIVSGLKDIGPHP